MRKVGFIGLGIMGKPMALRLIHHDYSLMVNDIDKNAAKELEAAGARVATYNEIGSACDVILTILPTGAIVQEVLFGRCGVAETISSGKRICDLSSVTPGESRACYEKLKQQGVGFVDAPVSGGEPGAIAGTLTIMCGGNQEDFDALRDVFDVLGASCLLIGPSGSGSITKLANQMIVNLNIAAASEALVFAVKAGIDPQKMYAAIRGGLAGSAVLDAKVPMMIERNFCPGGKISINLKDIKNVLDTARSIDAPVPFSAQLFEIMQALKVGGHLNDDHAGIVQFFEQLAGIKTNVLMKKDDFR